MVHVSRHINSNSVIGTWMSHNSLSTCFTMTSMLSSANFQLILKIKLCIINVWTLLVCSGTGVISKMASAVAEPKTKKAKWMLPCQLLYQCHQSWTTSHCHVQHYPAYRHSIAHIHSPVVHSKPISFMKKVYHFIFDCNSSVSLSNFILLVPEEKKE